MLLKPPRCISPDKCSHKLIMLKCYVYKLLCAKVFGPLKTAFVKHPENATFISSYTNSHIFDQVNQHACRQVKEGSDMPRTCGIYCTRSEYELKVDRPF